MNFLERGLVKLFIKKLEKRMPWLKRWVPFAASVATVVAVLLKQLGYGEYADAVLSLLALLPGPVETPDQALVVTAVVSVLGLGNQLWSRFQKARG